ncbi:MAG: sulfatase/phosphatase domain-containing protein, partial [Pseudomonadota bacterium]
LDSSGAGDDTLVMFLSDNGGCAELMEEDGWPRFYPDTNQDGSRVTPGNRSDLEPGGAGTFMSYDLPWANASNTPFRRFKHWVHEGGISTPLLARWPARLRGGVQGHEPAHVVDILPTILEATGAAMPSEIGGSAVQAPDGESLLPALSGDTWQRQQPIFWEHEGNAAIRLGPWKLVRCHGRDWELYEMDEDRTELTDLAARAPDRVAALIDEWQGWADGIGVRDWTSLSAELQHQWGIRGDQ